MYAKRDMLYADAYKYLKHKTKRIVALSINGSADDFEEVDMESPIKVVIVGKLVTWNNNLLACSSDELTYEAIKTKIIKSRYSNDDQLAIILNKDKDADGQLSFERMQVWREFATKIAKAVINI